MAVTSHARDGNEQVPTLALMSDYRRQRGPLRSTLFTLRYDTVSEASEYRSMYEQTRL
jgi:hypothetical protein